MRRALLALVLPLAAGCASPAATEPARPAEAAPVATSSIVHAEQAHAVERALALRLVREAPRFMGAAVGEGGDLPDVVLAYRRLLRQPDAAALFEALIGEATLAGRCYALCGLRQVAPARAEPLAAGLLADERTVARMDGCFVTRCPARELAQELLEDEDARLYQLRGDGTSWRQGAPLDLGEREDEVRTTLARIDALATVQAATEERARRDAQVAELMGDDPPFEPSEPEDPDEHLASWPGQDPLRELLAEAASYGPAGVPALEVRVGRPDLVARLAALTALQELGLWSAIGAGPAVPAALDDPHWLVRRAAIDVLGRRRDPEARAALLGALGRPGEETRIVERALEWIARLEPGPDLVDAVAALLSHPDAELRSRAVWRLAEVGPLAAPAQPRLEALARGEDDVADAAVQALARLEPRAAGLALADLLVERQDEARQADVAHSLIGVPGEGVHAATASVLERAAPERARAVAASAPGEARAAALAGTVRGASSAARLVALAALAHEPEGLGALEGFVAEPSLEDVALSALRAHGARALPALSRLADEGHLAAELRQLLRSDEPSDRAAALEWGATVAPGSEAAKAMAGAIGEWSMAERSLAEWDAAVTLLLRWDDRSALHVASVFSPFAEVRARAAAAAAR